MVKMLLKWKVRGRALNSHGNYIVDHGKSWQIMELCVKPDMFKFTREYFYHTYNNRHFNLDLKGEVRSGSVIFYSGCQISKADDSCCEWREMYEIKE